MKKFIIGFILFSLIFSFVGCEKTNQDGKFNDISIIESSVPTTEPSTENLIIGETSIKEHSYTIGNTEYVIPDFYGIEDVLILELYDKGYKNMKIYDCNELETEFLLNRKNSNNIIIERVIGIVTNAEQVGDGKILNASNENFDYICYNSITEKFRQGTIILTYFLYNPDTNYTDDVIERYDFVISREYED